MSAPRIHQRRDGLTFDEHGDSHGLWRGSSSKGSDRDLQEFGGFCISIDLLGAILPWVIFLDEKEGLLFAFVSSNPPLVTVVTEVLAAAFSSFGRGQALDRW